MKNSEMNAKARNKPIVSSPLWVVQPPKVKRSPFPLDAITSSLNSDVPSTLASFVLLRIIILLFNFDLFRFVLPCHLREFEHIRISWALCNEKLNAKYKFLLHNILNQFKA